MSDLQSIVSLYEKTLEIPTSIRPPQFFLCPVGYVGAGKSTVMMPLCEKLSLLRIENDVVRKLLREHGDFDSQHARDISRELIIKYARNGYSVGIDANCGSSSRRHPGSIEDISREMQIPIVWIHINPPEEFIVNKLRNYKHTWMFTDGVHAVEVFHKMKAVTDFSDIDFTYVFDTSREDMIIQVDDAVKIISVKMGKIA